MNSALRCRRASCCSEVHVAIVPGEGFGSSQHARLSYPVAETELDRGLERMRQFFAGL